MTKEEKLELLKAFLKKEKIFFKEKCLCNGQNTALLIPKYHICVKLSNENDQKFYECIKHSFHPLFIRESETAEFVIEKMQNLIISLMQEKQKYYLRKQSKKQ